MFEVTVRRSPTSLCPIVAPKCLASDRPGMHEHMQFWAICILNSFYFSLNFVLYSGLIKCRPAPPKVCLMSRMAAEG